MVIEIAADEVRRASERAIADREHGAVLSFVLMTISVGPDERLAGTVPADAETAVNARMPAASAAAAVSARRRGTRISLLPP